METSTKEFHRFRQDYVHTFAPVSDTGLKLNLLQNYIFVPLDIFRNHLDALLRPADKQPMTEKEAWLAFLSSDDPRVILRILEDYPGIFRPLYDRICTMCQNTKEMMHMFSEELSILDKNTVMMKKMKPSASRNRSFHSRSRKSSISAGNWRKPCRKNKTRFFLILFSNRAEGSVDD